MYFPARPARSRTGRFSVSETDCQRRKQATLGHNTPKPAADRVL